jgi:hypothetical protein
LRFFWPVVTSSFVPCGFAQARGARVSSDWSADEPAEALDSQRCAGRGAVDTLVAVAVEASIAGVDLILRLLLAGVDALRAIEVVAKAVFVVFADVLAVHELFDLTAARGGLQTPR